MLQGVPEQWGQPATGGTKFLGTPENYAELLKTRPVSPDLFGVEGASYSLLRWNAQLARARWGKKAHLCDWG